MSRQNVRMSYERCRYWASKLFPPTYRGSTNESARNKMKWKKPNHFYKTVKFQYHELKCESQVSINTYAYIEWPITGDLKWWPAKLKIFPKSITSPNNLSNKSYEMFHIKGKNNNYLSNSSNNESKNGTTHSDCAIYIGGGGSLDLGQFLFSKFFFQG